RIRDRDHVRLLDRVEARDRRAVEAHAVVERVFELADRDREALQVALDVREPEEDEVDALLLDPREDLLARRLARRRPVLALHLRHWIPPQKCEKPQAPGTAPEAPLPRRLGQSIRARCEFSSVAARASSARTS